MGFNVLVLAQLFNCLNSRSERESAFRGLFGNPLLWAAIAASLMLQVLVVHVPFLNHAFDTTPLSAADWVLARRWRAPSCGSTSSRNSSCVNLGKCAELPEPEVSVHERHSWTLPANRGAHKPYAEGRCLPMTDECDWRFSRGSVRPLFLSATGYLFALFALFADADEGLRAKQSSWITASRETAMCGSTAPSGLLGALATTAATPQPM